MTILGAVMLVLMGTIYTLAVATVTVLEMQRRKTKVEHPHNAQQAERAPFSCPICGAVSQNPMDWQMGYCGRCHAFTGTESGK